MYNELYTAWKREITDPSLGGLSPDFYSKLGDYIKRLYEQKEAPDKKSPKDNLLMHEDQNVLCMIEQLFNARYKKIIDVITETQKVPAELLTPEEIRISTAFFNFSDEYQRFVKSEMQGQLGAQSEATATVEPAVPAEVAIPTDEVPRVVVVKASPKRLTVRFSRAIPAIMGADMKSYGPFVPEDVASLPELNAKILVKQGLAVLIEVS